MKLIEKTIGPGKYPRKIIPIEERFWTKVSKTDNCWNWIAGIKENGYGVFHIGTKTYRAHRLSYEFANGAFPVSLKVLHECDNPRCVNPDHLFLGTSADNTLDMIKKDRHARGERIPQAKLKERDIPEIRGLYKAGGITHLQIARMFHVSRSTISMICSHSKWKHI